MAALGAGPHRVPGGADRRGPERPSGQLGCAGGARGVRPRRLGAESVRRTEAPRQQRQGTAGTDGCRTHEGLPEREGRTADTPGRGALHRAATGGRREPGMRGHRPGPVHHHQDAAQDRVPWPQGGHPGPPRVTRDPRETPLRDRAGHANAAERYAREKSLVSRCSADTSPPLASRPPSRRRDVSARPAWSASIACDIRSSVCRLAPVSLSISSGGWSGTRRPWSTRSTSTPTATTSAVQWPRCLPSVHERVPFAPSSARRLRNGSPRQPASNSGQRWQRSGAEMRGGNA